MGNCLHVCQGSEWKGRDNIQSIGFSARIMFWYWIFRLLYKNNYLKTVFEAVTQDTRCMMRMVDKNEVYDTLSIKIF